MQIINRPWPNPSPTHNEVPLLVDRQILAKRRWQGAATDGAAFGFDLEAPLHHRDVFFERGTTQYLIAQKPEPLLLVEMNAAESAARVAWSLGNLHFPIQIVSGFIRVTDDPAVRLFFEREGIAFTPRISVFHPAQAVGHSHGPAH